MRGKCGLPCLVLAVTLTGESLPQFPHLLLEVGGRGSSSAGKDAAFRTSRPERETLMKPAGSTGDHRQARARSGLEAEAGHAGMRGSRRDEVWERGRGCAV